MVTRSHIRCMSCYVLMTSCDGSIVRHYSDVIMSAMASQKTCVSIVNSTVCSGHRTHQTSASLAFVRGINQWPMNSPHRLPAKHKMFPIDDVIMHYCLFLRESREESPLPQISSYSDCSCLVYTLWMELLTNSRVAIDSRRAMNVKSLLCCQCLPSPHT